MTVSKKRREGGSNIFDLETYGQEDRRGRGKRENVYDESFLFHRWTDGNNQGGKINEKTFLCGAECIMEYAGRFI